MKRLLHHRLEASSWRGSPFSFTAATDQVGHLAGAATGAAAATTEGLVALALTDAAATLLLFGELVPAPVAHLIAGHDGPLSLVGLCAIIMP